MEPITRVHMHHSGFYDIPQPADDVWPQLARGTWGEFTTTYGQKVAINPRWVVAVRDLTSEPEMLASAWANAREASARS